MSANHHHPHHHVHDHQRGWARSGGRRGRWLEPFLLQLVAEGEAHGYALIGRLNELGVAAGSVDVGMAYRTLREFEAEGLVRSQWVAEEGAPRRAYTLTAAGQAALDEWAGVMCDRGRLIEEFLARHDRLASDKGG
jgi:DNA-binding PadR family transcriptional regulator